jgi:hypothetical protein
VNLYVVVLVGIRATDCAGLVEAERLREVSVDGVALIVNETWIGSADVIAVKDCLVCERVLVIFHGHCELLVML